MESILNREYISIEIVSDLWNFFKEKTNLAKDLTIDVYQEEDEHFGVEYFLNECGNYEFDCLILPYYCYLYEEEEMDIRTVLKAKYNFDMFTHIKGLTYGINDIVFSIFHEFGHLHQYFTTMSEEFHDLTYEYQYGLAQLSKMKDKIENEIQLQYYYRDLAQEKYADTIAIGLIKKYEKELYELLKKYNVGYEDEMIYPCGNYFEI